MDDTAEWDAFLKLLSLREDEIKQNPKLSYAVTWVRTHDPHQIKEDNWFELVYFEVLARKNDTWAMEVVCELYKHGWFVPCDFIKYMLFLRMRADHGDVTGMVELAELLATGNDECEKDLREAYVYFSKAANLIDPHAFYRTGDFYRDGLYVTEDPNTAFFLYSMAADLIKERPGTNEVEAAIYQRMAECLEKGIGTPRNTEKAKHYRELYARRLREDNEH